jgi:dienelactone hydrolase
MTVGLTGVATASETVARLELPRPTGVLPVGTTALHLRDESRADPWVPTERRELMVSLWYPAKTSAGTPSQYLTDKESELLVALLDDPAVPKDSFAKTKTYSKVDSPPLGLRAPLVVLSPGFTMPRNTMTSLAEDLASHGYVVAAIGHNYESIATTFPDGHTTECLACAESDDHAKVARGRAADVSFVLDQLTGPNPAWGGGKLIDTHRIAMAGFSAGGFSVAPAMLADSRIDAGVSLEGAFVTSAAGLNRPYLMIGEPEHEPGNSADWSRGWTELAGWKRWLTVDGAQHYSFSDLVLLAEQLGIEPTALTGERGIQVTRAYVGAFVDRHLRGWPEPLLNRPSTRFTEVRHWAP